MLSLRRMSPILFLFLIILYPVSVMAYWPLDGVCLSTAPYSQSFEVSVEDGSGGAIIIFIDDRYGNDDIFAQRIDRNGNVMWDHDGVPICTVTGAQDRVDAVSDGAGGALITWEDARGGPTDIYVQRIGPDGVRLWSTAGVSICSAVNDQSYPRIATDGSGGGIVFWQDLRNGKNDLYARRIDNSGSVLWDIWGIPVYTGGDVSSFQQAIASDGLGGAFLVWPDQREGPGNYNIYYNHVDSDGVLTWSGDGLVVCDATGNQFYPELHEIGVDRIAVLWNDFRVDGDEGLYTKIIRANGSWWGNGIEIWTDPNSNIRYASMTGDSENGLYVCWEETRNSEDDIFIQRIDFAGGLCWVAGGINVSDGDNVYQTEPLMISDDDGGVILTWGSTMALGSSIRTQRIDRDGSFLWPAGGVKTHPESRTAQNKGIVPNGEGGAVVIRADYSYDIPNPHDLYSQHIDRNGYIGSPEPMIDEIADVPMDQGGKIELTWDASYLDPWPNQEITYYSIWKSLTPASATMMMENDIEYTDLQAINLDADSRPGIPSGIIVRRETVGAATYYWELLETQAAQYYEGYSKVLDTDFTSLETAFTWSYYQVAAHTGDPLVVWTSQPDSGYSLDNLAPAAPVGLEGEQEYSPEGMDLVWNSNTEEDLSHYVIYRGTDPSFIPSSTNELTSAYDTMYFDGGWSWEDGYVYKVSAIDIHGNESGYALLLPGQVTGDEPPTPANSDYLSQNWPNPFNPSTTIQFGLKESGHVRLSIYDASGRLISELVNSTLPAGSYSEIWNGTNSSGAYVASGIYFYRLDSGEFSMKKKLVLLR